MSTLHTVSAHPAEFAATMRERGHTTFTATDRCWTCRPGGNQAAAWRAAIDAATTREQVAA